MAAWADFFLAHDTWHDLRLPEAGLTSITSGQARWFHWWSLTQNGDFSMGMSLYSEIRGDTFVGSTSVWFQIQVSPGKDNTFIIHTRDAEDNPRTTDMWRAQKR